MVRPFTETFSRGGDIESPNIGSESAQVVAAPAPNTSASVTQQHHRIEEPSNLPFSRPNVVAVTASPEDELGYILGFESTPYGGWRSPVHKFCCQIYPTCMCSSFLPFLVIAQLNQKLGQATFFTTTLYFMFGFIFIGLGVILFESYFVLLLVVLPIMYYAFQLRQYTRKQFKLPGSGFTDCLLSFCFPICVIAQVKYS